MHKQVNSIRNILNRVPFVILLFIMIGCSDDPEFILDSIKLKKYVEGFNQKDNELYKQHVPNDSAYLFLEKNIPLIDVPDKDIEETYYFRWWTYRKHLKKTSDGFVITEFLPNVPWAGKHNTINCPAGHHIYEGRWLRNPKYICDYIDFWLKKSDDGVRQYSFWVANASIAFHSLHPNDSILSAHLPLLIDNYEAWVKTRKDEGYTLFWQNDVQDGMELTVSGRILNEGESIFSMAAIRPSINSYMYGDAKAISIIATITSNPSLTSEYQEKAQNIKQALQNRLWNKELNYFTVLPRNFTDTTSLVNVRELIGLIPWYFNLPDDNSEYALAWSQVMDTTGFYAPYGLSSCERSHPFFAIHYTGHECQWNGPSWPFATTQTLKGMSNLLNNYSHHGGISKDDYYQLLLQYAKSHSIVNDKGERQKWIDENINPFTGDWISRTRLKTWDNGKWSKEKGGIERGKDYNHSGFCDLVISDLLGLKPFIDNRIELNPLIPDNWDWFCLDRVLYQGKEISVIWDSNGEKYHRGKGLMLFVDGKLKAKSDKIQKLIFTLE